MAPWEYTIAELLSDAGYATSMYGKWHIGDKDGRLPNDQADFLLGKKETSDREYVVTYVGDRVLDLGCDEICTSTGEAVP